MTSVFCRKIVLSVPLRDSQIYTCETEYKKHFASQIRQSRVALAPSVLITAVPDSVPSLVQGGTPYGFSLSYSETPPRRKSR